MKKIMFIISASFCYVFVPSLMAQNYSSYDNSLSGKTILSSIEQVSMPPKNPSVQSPSVSSGGLSITVKNNAVSNNTLERRLIFTKAATGIRAERSFLRIKTHVKRESVETMVDTDNAFERPEGMEKLGERYDALVKEKCVHLLSPGGVTVEQQKMAAEDYWNQYLPFLSLDSALNCIVFKAAAAMAAGSQWDDSAQNNAVKYFNSYRVKSITDGWVLVECSGKNTYIPSAALESSTAINMQIQRLALTYTGNLLVNAATGFVKQADFSVINTNRKYAMGHKIDSERNETVKLTNVMQ